MSSADADSLNLYGYVPTKSVCIIFVILYAVSSLLHTWQAVRSRAWWLLPTAVVAGIAEVIGWAARAKSSGDPLDRNTFIIQSTLLVLAPTPLVAALFVGFGRLSERLGPEYSRLSPRWYSRIFLTCDIFSLLIQGGGGGIAATAGADVDKVRLGSNVILGGLIFQIASMTTFCYFMAEYAWRRAADRPFRKPELGFAESARPLSHHILSKHSKLLIIGICVSMALVYVRSVYRTIEFANGFNGPIAHNQVLFNVFDGMLVTLAMYTLNFMHPGRLLKAADEDTAYALTDRSQTSFSRRTSPTVEAYMVSSQK